MQQRTKIAGATISAAIVAIIAVLLGPRIISEATGTGDDREPGASTVETDEGSRAEWLVAPEEMPIVNDSDFSWRESSTGSGNEEFSRCVTIALSDFGAEEMIRRGYVWGPHDSEVSGDNVVATFSSGADAASAADEIFNQARDCSQRQHATSPVPVTIDGLGYGYAWNLTVPGERSGLFEYAGFVKIGDRISLLSWRHAGQDSIGHERSLYESMRHSAKRLTTAR